MVAKITDFGLSAELDPNVFRGNENINDVTGTLLYMAPEQATGKRYSQPIDVWALGIIVFKLLTGKHPFYLPGDKEQTYTQRISKGSLEPLLREAISKFEISPLAQSLIERLLAKGISDRY